MSSDYYLVCKRKKIVIPVFSMSAGGCGYVSKNWMFDFILACEDNPSKLLSEHSSDLPDYHDDDSWTFMNAWHDHPNDKRAVVVREVEK